MKVSDVTPIYNIVKIKEFQAGDGILLELGEKRFFIEYSLDRDALLVKDAKIGKNMLTDSDILAEIEII